MNIVGNSSERAVLVRRLSQLGVGQDVGLFGTAEGDALVRRNLIEQLAARQLVPDKLLQFAHLGRGATQDDLQRQQS